VEWNNVYLLDLVDHSWTMGLNFRSMELSQFNLIRVEERTLSSPNPHQYLFVKSNLGRWEIQGRVNIWW